MKYYYFAGGDHTKKRRRRNPISVLEDHGFSGVLFTYNSLQGDYFTRIARDIDLSQKIIYMIAIRPYAISPQYLTMINQSISSIMPNRLQINLISGHIKEEEKNFGGILGNVTDSSSNIDRSNYLISYIEELDKMKQKNKNKYHPDFFVTTTNEYVFDAASKLNNKMIIPYREYKRGFWSIYTNREKSDHFVPGKKINLKNEKVMISVSPVIRKTQKEIDSLDKKMWTIDTEYFTYESFNNFVKKLELEGINHLMVHAWPIEERYEIINYIKEIS